ncbi:hypothetical protein AAAC51_06785 [Priestia megaterium]
MYIDTIFNELKNRMIEEIKGLTLDNFSRYKDLTDSQYKIIEQLIELKKMDTTYEKLLLS